MALAGISEWRIQVFGRWDSSAIVGCLRDSLIIGAAGALAQEVECARDATRGLSSVADLAPLLKADAVMKRAAFERVVSSGAAPAGVERQEDALSAIRKELASVQAELAVVSARALPEAVICTGSGKAHLVANLCVTHCGWQWASHSGSYRLAEGGMSNSWCKKCCSTADRLKREVIPQSP